MTIKVCSKCKIGKNAEEKFRKDNSNICKKCKSLYQKKYRERNKEYLKKLKQAWRDNNPEYGIQWRQNNPHSVFNSHSLHKLQTTSVYIPITLEEYNELFKSTDNKCFYCKEDLNKTNKRKTLDHVIPLSRGGDHTIENLVPACISCNCRKGFKTLEEWKLTPNCPIKNNDKTS